MRRFTFGIYHRDERSSQMYDENVNDSQTYPVSSLYCCSAIFTLKRPCPLNDRLQ